MYTINNNRFGHSDTNELLLASAGILLAHSREKIFIKDQNLLYRGASPKFVAMAGAESAKNLIGKTDFEIFEDQELAQRYREDDLKLIAQQQDLIDYVEPLTEKDGHARFASTSKFVLKDQRGRFLGILGFSRDITNEYYLKRHSSLALEYLFDLPPNTYFSSYIDLDEWRIVNEHHQAVQGREFATHIHVDHLIEKAYEHVADRRWPAAAFYHNFSRENIASLYESGKTKLIMEYRRVIPDGSIRWVCDEIHLLKDNVSGHLCMMLVVHDIHSAKMAEEERLRLAERDELTGLLNRKATMQLIQERLEHSHEDDRHALLMIDADYFKSVNDTYGHQAGDKVLTDLAQEISNSFRSTDIIGRIGGDEFFVLMTHVPDRYAVEKKVSTLLSRIKAIHYEDVYLSASIGISLFPDNAQTLEAMYATADKAMYAAKETRGNVIFAEDLPAAQ